MMWLCRPGQQSRYFKMFDLNNRIYLAWEGYKADLSHMSTRMEYKNLVITEKNPTERRTISNWAGQLFSFAQEMDIGDYVIIPEEYSARFSLARIIGDYSYNKDDIFAHSREVEWIVQGVPRGMFPIEIQNSMRAYRTLFRVKQEDVILAIVNSWKEKIGLANKV